MLIGSVLHCLCSYIHISAQPGSAEPLDPRGFQPVDCLNTLAQQFVHPADLAGYTVVDSPLSNVDDETAEDLGVDLCDDLQFLAL